MCVCRAETGKGETHENAEGAAGFICPSHVKGGGGRQLRAPIALPGRRAAPLRLGHNSDDRNEGDGGHPAGLSPR